MITSVKKYGSYLLSNVTPYSQDIADDSAEPNFISTCTIPSFWTELSLLSITPYNHDTSIFRFTLPPRAQKLNLPIGGFVLVLAPGREHDGSDAVRPYTSVSDDEIQNNPATSKEEFIPSSSSSAKQTNRWMLITRAHFTELIAYISLQTDIAPSVSCFLCFLFVRSCLTLFRLISH
jgi:hypothetical protein